MHHDASAKSKIKVKECKGNDFHHIKGKSKDGYA
jgi:hypothetical protein